MPLEVSLVHSHMINARSRRWRLRAAALLTVVFVGIACAAYFYRNRPQEILRKGIHDAGFRPIHLRLAMLPYAPMNPGARSTTGTAARSLRQIRAAAARVLARDGITEHEGAAARLISGDVDRAILILDKIVSTNPSNAAYWNDLGVARFELGLRQREPFMLVKALAACDRALELEPELAAAAFNAAAILDQLGLVTEADQAFHRFLALDGTSAWATEARVILQSRKPSLRSEWNTVVQKLQSPNSRLTDEEIRQIVTTFPELSRRWTEGIFLGHWADAIADGRRGDADHWLHLSSAIANTLRDFSGEALAADAIAVIRASTDDERQRLAGAYRIYRSARITYDSRNATAAIPLLEKAEQEFERLQSPMKWMSAYYRANALVDVRRREEATDIRERLLRAVPPSHRALHAQLAWLEGTIIGITGRPYDALSSYETALATLRDLSEIEGAARMRGTCAAMRAALGEISDPWHLYAETLRDAAHAGAAWLTEVTLNDAARQEIANGRLDTARALLHVALARPRPNPRLHFDTLMWLAFVDAKLGGQPPDFRRATLTAHAMKDIALRHDALDELRFAQAVHTTTDPRVAVELLSQTIQYRQANDYHLWLPPVYYERARRYRAMQNTAAAESDLRAAIRAISKSSTNVAPVLLRDSYFGTARDAHRELMELLADRGRLEDALRVADEARLHALFRRSEGPSPAVIKNSLAPGVVLVRYALLEQRMVVSAITSSSVETKLVDVGRKQVVETRDELVQAIDAHDATRIGNAARTLHDYLLGAVEPALSRATTLVVVPDDAVSDVPFAALQPRDGAWLIERMAIVLTPVAVAFDAMDLAPWRIATTSVVADPAFDSRRFGTLERLAAARRDAHTIDAMLSNVSILAETTATRPNVVRAITSADLVHIAVHAVADRTDASRSFMVLAPSPSDAGVLHAAEIARLDMTQARMVVLAGCQTAAAGGGRGSIRSLALAFLAGGARSVMGTLWSVDDAATSTLTRDTYMRIASNGASPIVALRDAQLRAIRAGRAPRDWASHQIYVQKTSGS